ncbi:skeletal aspartic acid-rich protein 1-like [Prunus avium]|uniref:Skeletal aspartic acid-rich protein 1-like n=1 Tax=Prunus avium TaxID=42229 RepID=A0A6P5U015_PRUAV|nr:skeletal aspartic acid-rich protein 1-like [Prunus avium]
MAVDLTMVFKSLQRRWIPVVYFVFCSSAPTRKYISGYTKRLRKRKFEELTQSQRGALDRFIVKESHATIDENVFSEQQEDDVEELQDIENNMDECVGNAEQNENDDNENADIDDHNEDVEDLDIENDNNENIIDSFNE